MRPAPNLLDNTTQTMSIVATVCFVVRGFLLILSIIKDRLRETQKKFLETKLNEDQWASLIKSENSTTKLVLNKMCLDLFKLNINRKFLNNFEIRVYSYRQNKNTSDEIDKEIDTFFRNLGSYCVLSINDILID